MFRSPGFSPRVSRCLKDSRGGRNGRRAGKLCDSTEASSDPPTAASLWWIFCTKDSRRLPLPYYQALERRRPSAGNPTGTGQHHTQSDTMDPYSTDVSPSSSTHSKIDAQKFSSRPRVDPLLGIQIFIDSILDYRHRWQWTIYPFIQSRVILKCEPLPSEKYR